MSISPEVKSQILGTTLALSTAIGCIAYERIVKACSFSTILILAILFYAPTLIFFTWYSPSALSNDLMVIFSDTKLKWMAFIYILSGCTAPLWYIITKKQGVMVSSIYEVKYIVMLALIYIMMGDKPFTTNTGIGVGLAIVSI